MFKECRVVGECDHFLKSGVSKAVRKMQNWIARVHGNV